MQRCARSRRAALSCSLELSCLCFLLCLYLLPHTHTQMASSNSGKRENAKQNTRDVSKRAKAKLKNAARL